MKSQDKFAEMKASGAVLDRHDSDVWTRRLHYKQDNLHVAGLDTLTNAIVLDFGCGPGTFGVLLGMRNHVIGIDIAKKAIEQARDRAKRLRSEMDLVVADGELLGIRQNSVDLCFSGWAIHHLPRVATITDQFYELCKPEGLVVIIEPNEDAPALRITRFIEEKLRGLVIDAGLDTPNRTTHTRRDYVSSLVASGFKIEKVFSHYNGERAQLPNDIKGFKRIMLETMILSRHFILSLGSYLPQGGAEVFVVGVKPGTQINRSTVGIWDNGNAKSSIRKQIGYISFT